MDRVVVLAGVDGFTQHRSECYRRLLAGLLGVLDEAPRVTITNARNQTGKTLSAPTARSRTSGAGAPNDDSSKGAHFM